MRYTIAFVTLATGALLATSPPAHAEPFVHRDLTLPGGVWAVDLGLGIGHLDLPEPLADVTGLGFNIELKAGLTPRLQLGLRTGIRVGRDGRITQADRYGRTFETETYDTGGDTVANPEISLRYALVDSPTLDLALDGRVYLPLDGDVGVMVAMPLALHLSPWVRFDTGIYVPIIFSDPTASTISFPFHLWLQADRLAVGPMTGVTVHNPGGGTTIPLGLGLNYAASSEVDLRTWLLFPNIKGGGGKTFGGGFGIEARF